MQSAGNAPKELDPKLQRALGHARVNFVGPIAQPDNARLAAGAGARIRRAVLIEQQDFAATALQPVRGALMESLLHDIRFGCRMLLKNPGFAAVAIITLALGIGVNTSIFSMVDWILLRPLPVKDPAQLTELAFQQRRGNMQNQFS